MKKSIYIIAFGLCSISLWAQDPQFSQFYHTPVYLNPSLAGETRQWKFSFNSRFQWMSTPTKYVSNSFTAELAVPANQSGFGLQVLHDRAGSGNLSFVSVGGIYAFKGILNRKLRLNFGMKASFNQRFFDVNSLTFATEIAEAGEGSSALLNSSVSYLDLAFGTSLSGRNWWAGLSLDHLNSPYYSFTNEKSRLPVKFSTHFMYLIPIKKNLRRQLTRSVVIGGNFKTQKNWNQIDIGGYFNYEKVSLGLFYRGIPLEETVPNEFNRDAMVLVFGYTWLGLKVYYSYDITISRVWQETGGSHEFALITEYPFKPKKRRRSSRFLPCPKF